MAQSNSYSSPQKIVDQRFDVFRKARLQQQAQFQRTLAVIQQRNVANKKAQQVRYENQMRQKGKMENSISGFSDTGNDMFDSNIKTFWDSRVDDYFEIKNGITSGEIDAVRGKQALDKINAQVTLYKQATEPILKLAKAVSDASQIKPGEPGSISSVTNQEMQNVLLGIANGGNVNIVNREGELFLFMPGPHDSEGSSINISNLLKQVAAGNAVTFHQDTSKFDNKQVDHILKPQNMESPYITTEYEENADNADNEDMFRFITPEQSKDLKNNMWRSGSYGKTVEDNDYMTPLWADIYNDKNTIRTILGNELIGDTGIAASELANTEWQVIPDDDYYRLAGVGERFLKAQRMAARQLMIDRSVTRRLAQLGYSEERKYTGTSKKRGGQQTPYTAQTLNSRGDEIDEYISYAQNSPSLEDLSIQLNRAAGKVIYKIKDGKIYEGNTELVIDMSDPNAIAVALGEAAGIEKRVMKVALLPKNK